MPRRKSPTPDADDDLFFASGVLPGGVIGKASECAELLAAWKKRRLRIFYGREAAFLRDLGYRISSGPNAQELGDRWPEHMTSLVKQMEVLLRLGDPTRTAAFWNSGYALGIKRLNDWDFERGGGVRPPKVVTPVIRDGTVVGQAAVFGPGEGRAIRRKPASGEPVFGEFDPPLQDYEHRMLDVFLSLFPKARRSHRRGQPEVRDWRLEGPRVGFAADGTPVLQLGALIGFYRRFCLAIKDYQAAMRGGRLPDGAQEADVFRDCITGIVGKEKAGAWLQRFHRPLHGKAKIAVEGCASGHRTLFCEMIVDAIGSDRPSDSLTITVKSRLIKYLDEWESLTKKYRTASLSYPSGGRAPRRNELWR